MKKNSIIAILLMIAIVTFGIIIVASKKATDITPPDTDGQQPIAMCYQYTKQTAGGLTDRAWLKMNIDGTKVTGEYQNLPAEKDSKAGTFTGTVGAMDPNISARTADVMWKSMAEGMTVTEQLKIQFGEGSAVALFGEMVDRGDGTYLYKDVTKLTSGFQMSQIDCEQMSDMILVEKYIRENIKTIAPEKPVLGGSWYVISVQVMPATKTGAITYEDGHIQGKATFAYTVSDDSVTISNVQKSK